MRYWSPILGEDTSQHALLHLCGAFLDDVRAVRIIVTYQLAVKDADTRLRGSYHRGGRDEVHANGCED